MKALFDDVSIRCSRMTTRAYSTSFSLGILCLRKEIRDAIYAIYGFVRFADEIVDTFHDYDKQLLLNRFREDTYRAIEEKISLNPILNSFQDTVHRFRIERELIDCFLRSMEMDLTMTTHNDSTFDTYVLGSAESVGLMCLRVFTDGDAALYEHLKPSAMSLGAAFQKVNFLRDLQADYTGLGRAYFPGINPDSLDLSSKQSIQDDIERDFNHALAGIKQLPRSARFGVYMAYVYYRALFNKIKNMPSGSVLESRVRIPNTYKATLLAYSYIRHQFNII